MSKLEDQLAEDRLLRDGARDLFKAELAQLRQDTAPESIGEKLANRIGEKADAASSVAGDFLSEHRGKFTLVGSAMAGAAALWFARRPIVRKISAFRQCAAAMQGSDTEPHKPQDQESPMKDAENE